MLVILKKIFLPGLFHVFFRYDSPKKCSTILYAVNLCLKPVSGTGARLMLARHWVSIVLAEALSKHETST